MSISGLSNHLYVVVTTVISLLFAPSTFHQARASLVSDDFTESRQFKKNLAVSKFKDHPHWLPEYVWKPPEKFYGPRQYVHRKRPKWEMETTTQSRDTLSKQKEFENWEKKMRDVSNRARRKWKIYETQEKLQPKSNEMIPGHTNEKFVSDKNSDSTENNYKNTDFPDRWINENQTLREIISNGRWGMSVKKAPSDFVDEILKSQQKSISTDSPKLLETRKSMRQQNKSVTPPTTFFNGRWGMSVTEAKKYFTNQKSESQQKSLPHKRLQSLETRNSTRLSNDGVTPPTEFINGRWGMNMKKAPKDFMKNISKSQPKSPFIDSLKSLESINLMSQQEDNVTSAATISNGRWGINVKEPPKEFLKEMSRRSQTVAISDRVWKQDEDPKSTGNRIGSEIRVKEVSVAEGPVETNLPEVFPSGRWGMSSDLPPREFLREISRRGLSGIPEFYKSTDVHQRAHEIAENNLRSRELMFSKMSGISNILFPRPFPILIGPPTCPICMLISLKILPDHNCGVFSHFRYPRQFL